MAHLIVTGFFLGRGRIRVCFLARDIRLAGTFDSHRRRLGSLGHLLVGKGLGLLHALERGAGLATVDEAIRHLDLEAATFLRDLGRGVARLGGRHRLGGRNRLRGLGSNWSRNLICFRNRCSNRRSDRLLRCLLQFRLLRCSTICGRNFCRAAGIVQQVLDLGARDRRGGRRGRCRRNRCGSGRRRGGGRLRLDLWQYGARLDSALWHPLRRRLGVELVKGVLASDGGRSGQ